MKWVHFLNIFSNHEASVSGSGFVHCWLQHCSGSVWSTDILQGVILINRGVVSVKRGRIYHGLLRRQNYTGGRHHCVLQKGSAGCQFEDMTLLNLHYVHHMCVNIDLRYHMRKQQGNTLSSNPNQGNLHPL